MWMQNFLNKTFFDSEEVIFELTNHIKTLRSRFRPLPINYFRTADETEMLGTFCGHLIIIFKNCNQSSVTENVMLTGGAVGEGF